MTVNYKFMIGDHKFMIAGRKLMTGWLIGDHIFFDRRSSIYDRLAGPGHQFMIGNHKLMTGWLAPVINS